MVRRSKRNYGAYVNCLFTVFFLCVHVSVVFPDCQQFLSVLIMIGNLNTGT